MRLEKTGIMELDKSKNLGHSLNHETIFYL